MSGEERARDERLDERERSKMSGEERARDERLDERERSRMSGGRAFAQWPIVLALAAVWVLLWGELNALNVVAGLLVAIVVLAVFPLPPLIEPVRFRPLPLIRLLARFAYDVVVASVQVAAQALWFGHQPMNAVIEVRLRARSDLFLTLTAELVSLVPGSLLIEVEPVGDPGAAQAQDRNVLFVHIFGVRDLADVERARADVLAQERRVVEALATDADLEAYHRTVREELP
ncbi:Na+/H+ antiporter subunit E [Solicola gregarius]|uniref:Na+/H+ antiporter subunit E n=1 Tax=Solicola gregarius TaxID=2908642 RepID=A0AA46TEU8_9ACTN|nr:Na+/H+ antiporter subunit E [Solicola gregarius]UYM03574.1 Na+/H+ antiporter subunit E [Solicola gregarius]